MFLLPFPAAAIERLKALREDPKRPGADVAAEVIDSILELKIMTGLSRPKATVKIANYAELDTKRRYMSIAALKQQCYRRSKDLERLGIILLPCPMYAPVAFAKALNQVNIKYGAACLEVLKIKKWGAAIPD